MIQPKSPRGTQSAASQWLPGAIHPGRGTGGPPSRSLPLVLALLPAACYGFFGLIAYLQYPSAFNPVHHTLSELGSPTLNPDGSGFYRLGCVLGGAMTIVFFLHLAAWRRSGTRLQDLALLGVQAFGVAVGTAMMLFAAFPNNESLPHLIVLGLLANCSLALMLLSLYALHRADCPQRVRITATLVAAGAILLMYAIPSQHWAEWLAAFLSQVFLWTVGYEMARPWQPLDRRPPGVA